MPADFESLQRKIERLESLVEATSVLNSTLDYDELFQLIMELAARQMNADRSTLFLLDASRRNLISKVALGLESKEISLRVGTGIAGAVAETGDDIIIINDAYADSRFNQEVDLASGYRTRSILCVPVRNRAGEIAGVMQVLNKKSGVFDREDAEYLKALSSQAAIVLERVRQHKTEIEQQRVVRELSLAREIQLSLLPSAPPQVEGFDIAGVNRACFEVGGDYFDYFVYSEQMLGVAIADVSGKGVPAALHTTALRSMLNLLTDPGNDLSEFAATLNDNTTRNTNGRSFITFFYALLDGNDSTLAYVNAGHNYPIIVSPANCAVRKLRAGGPPLGILPGMSYDCAQVSLNAGDVVCLYTDGLAESFNDKGEEFGTTRIIDVICRTPGATSSELCDLIVKDVERFVNGDQCAGLCPLHDDLTLVIARSLRGRDDGPAR